MKNRKDIYLDKVLEQIPYLLSHLNRDPASHIYGSFDRAYWAWGNKDYSNADFQRGVYPLSILYTNNFKNNRYYGNEKILTWIEAALNFWVKIQNKNGSFNQWYPYEYSVGTTAFTIYPVSETYMMIKNKLDKDLKRKLECAFKKGADFIIKNEEKHGFISNHLAGMALALYNVFSINQENKYKAKSEEILSRILRNQSEEGWYKEYGGADPGYESLGIYYLANLWKKTYDSELLDSLKKSVDFYTSLIKPDKTVGGLFGSRNTELFFPSGFEILKKEIPVCNDIINFLLESVITDDIPTINNIDFYNFIPLLDSYTAAIVESKEAVYKNEVDFPVKKKIGKFNYFDKSKVLTVDKDKYFAVLGISKGGAIEVYSKGKLVYVDDGFLGKTKSGRLISNQKFDLNRKVHIDGQSVCFESCFYILPDQNVTPFKNFVLRGITGSVGRFLPFNKLIKRVLSYVLILGLKEYPLILKSTIKFDDNKIEINENISGKKLKSIESLYKKTRFFTVFMGSSRYFSKHELDFKEPGEKNFVEIIEKNCIQLNTKIEFDEKINIIRY